MINNKTHMLTNIEKMPLYYTYTGSKINDAIVGQKFIQKNIYMIKYMLGYKAYNTDKILKILEKSGVHACIPQKLNRKNPVTYDKNYIKKRRIVESMF